MTRQFDVQGHRGARGLFPENTIAGFKAAMAIGVRGFELDVGISADGVAVLCHDLALNADITRRADGTWLAAPTPLVRALTFAQLTAFDVGRIRPGSAYAARFPAQAPIDGARIPSLADMLAATGDAMLTIELKTDPTRPDDSVGGPAMADAVMAVVDAAGAAGRVMLESFDWRGPRHLRRTRPEIACALLTAPETLAAARSWWDGPQPSDYGGSVAAAVAAEGVSTWAPEHADLTAQDIAAGGGRAPRARRTALDGERPRCDAPVARLGRGRADHRPTRSGACAASAPAPSQLSRNWALAVAWASIACRAGSLSPSSAVSVSIGT
jgi:glycerophosphoryl diester phosphodiesterase